MRLIDKEQAYQTLSEYYHHRVTLQHTALREALDRVPVVDAVPVRHGKWIDEGQYGDFFPHHGWRCSECGEHVIEIDTPWYKYCPNCGARMDAE